MTKVRAIYKGDIKYDNCPVFELKDNGYFEMIIDNDFRYEKSIVESDDDWLIFNVNIEEEEVENYENIN